MRFCEAPNCSQPVFGTCKKSRKGYCKSHQSMREDFDRRSIVQKAMAKSKEQPSSSLKSKIRTLHSSEENREMVKSGSELNRWFDERRKELTGYCKHCGGKSCKDDDKYFKFSICHILPKAYFKSIATHESNFIELCFWNNSCHTQMDNKMLYLIDMNCWDEIVIKFAKMYPSIAKEERRRIPDVLLQYLDAEI